MNDDLTRELADALADADGAEINPSNYAHDDVCYLNDSYVAVFQVAERAIAALRATPGATPAERSCTCHPDDRPAGPCPKCYAATECQAQAGDDAGLIKTTERILFRGYNEAADAPKGFRIKILAETITKARLALQGDHTSTPEQQEGVTP